MSIVSVETGCLGSGGQEQGAHVPQTTFDGLKYARDEERVKEGFWTKIRRTAARVPFAEDAISSYYCATDRDTPLRVKAVLMGALAYFVLPADVIPDFIAAFGFTDDATVLYAAIKTVSGSITDKHKSSAQMALGTLSR